jgi:transcriptional regulator with XRE-family HTH domain
MEPNEQAMALADRIRQARETKGWSKRELARLTGFTHSFISKLEAGQIAGTAPGNLITLARVLEITPEDLYALAGYDVPDRLPTFGPYLRARYGEKLPEDAMKALSDMFDVLSSQYQPNDDEASDEVEDSPANGRGGSLR